MLLTRFYYSAKPWIPPRARLALRRWHARWILSRSTDVWPILDSAGRKPEGWPGWPDGKEFALVLTHDVESSAGLGNVKLLAELEMSLGFRSAFYFVPEGEYTVPPALRSWLVDHGFEVGVHDLHHDGKLFRNRTHFRRCADKINRYLEDWNAVGFRSAYMLRNLDWFHDLNIQYDSSTFDTDPFEPQPEGVSTIFPFWVAGYQDREEGRGNRGNSKPDKPNLSCSPPYPPNNGYLELPYTLPQDSTLFFLLHEMSPRIWLRKLDWIAQHGGMALVDVHPDYVIMPADNSRKPGLPLESYTAFLSHVQRRCNDQPWTALPKEVVQHARKHLPHPPMTLTSRKAVVQIGSTSQAHKIWIDLDNTPHVPFFEPIIEELNRLGHRVLLTARDAFQVCELADQKGLRYTRVGRHHGKHKLVKGLGLFWRASQLASTILREKPDLGLSHGSRSQVILCNVLRIPSVMLADYEYARLLPLMCPTWEMAPEVVPNDSLYCPPDRVRKYPGIKEDVYVSRLRPDPGLLGQLGLNGKDLIVTVRPPATEAHYHNPDSERLFVHFMNRACRCEGLRVVLLPRNLRQGHELCAHFPHWFAGARTVIPNGAVDGLNLLWYSDLVVSGGGTMNREAAALGVPVYSIFRGRIGAVDHYLQSQGRLVLIETTDDIERKIEIRRRDRSPMNVSPKPTVQALPAIIEHLEEILRVQYPEETAKRS